MAIPWLVCEGKSDLAVLGAVFENVLEAGILLKASGGSTSSASVAEYLSSEGTGRAVAYVIDRDYQERAVADATFRDGRKRFMWRRHAMESYLLEPAVVARAFGDFKASLADTPHGGPEWAKGLPAEVDTLAAGLRACAERRAPQEAGRLALERLWEKLHETAGRIEKSFVGPLSAGDPDAAASREALVEWAARLVHKAQETVASPLLAPSAIRQRYDDELARVSAESYLAGSCFIEEFHGKKLVEAFLKWLEQEYNVSLRRDRFIQELEKAVPKVYKANRLLYGTDDFLDLANGVRALAGLPLLS